MINIRKAGGPEELPKWILRDLAGILAPPICAIFNSSFREGYIPPIWKCANTYPLPKTNPPKRLEKDLCPISLTPIISKTIEIYACSCLREISEPILDQHQFGSRKTVLQFYH